MALPLSARQSFFLTPSAAIQTSLHLVRLTSQGLLLTLVYLVGSGLASSLRLPVPGNVVGLLVLLGLLASGAVRTSQIEELCSFALKHLTFFFVPLAVGLMTHGDLLATAGTLLVACLVGAAAMGIGTAGVVAQTVARSGGSARADQ